MLAGLAVGLACLSAGVERSVAGAKDTVVGRYVEVHADRGAHPTLPDHTLRFLRTGSTVYRLHLPHGRRFRSRATLSVTGTIRGRDFYATDATQVAPAPAAATTGTQSLLVELVRWGSDTLTTDQTTAQSVVFGPDSRSVKNWYSTASDGQFSWVGAVTPIMTIAQPSAACDVWTIASEADSAAQAAGYDLAAYPTRMIDFPSSAGCSAAGYGSIGGPYAWIQNGLYTLDDGYQRLVPTHELGHTLGLYHSHGLECGTVVISPACLSTSASNDEYGNAWDVMGNNWPGDGSDAVADFSAPQQQQLGWLTNVQTVSLSGSYTISPLEAQTPAHAQALIITTADHEYTIEFRQPLGVDTWLTGWPQATQGVQINLRDDLPGGDLGPLNLDTTPNSDITTTYSDTYDSALTPGHTYTDPDGAFTLSVTSVSSTGVTVSLTFKAAGTPGAPTANFIVPSIMSTDPTAPTVPYSIGWAQNTCSATASYVLMLSTDSGSYSTVFTGTSRTTTVNLAPGHTYRFQVACGGAAATGTQFSLTGSQETIATYHGTWTTSTFTGAWGGTAKYSKTAGAYATFTCTCEALAWVTDEDANHGSAKVYIDGVLKKTINTQTTTATNRAIVYKIGWPSDATHTIKIVNVGTSGHPRITIDGFLRRS
jgi:Dual-action HEIGH metallo-peptidase